MGGKRKAEEAAEAPAALKKKVEAEDEDDDAVPKNAKTYTERLQALSVIATPLADEKLTKKLHKLVKKASAGKVLRRGVKEVVKALRKGSTGLCIIAGDIAPVDVICHLPVFCEEKKVAYIYVPSKHDLGFAALTKRPTSCVLVSPKAGVAFEHQDLLDKAIAAVKKVEVKF
ncbi:50S ribosomal protein L30e-like protein [Pelagophyceae sp. CCMP2097]|nr:50S ribosomal protein L30e-like protein [Pelagophyceae sp. CCMP2097]